jgi:riboflavin biosynthesis pyrimidine reductase
MHFVWPGDEARVVDDDELERLYSYPADPRWVAVNYVSSADGAVEVGGRARRLSNAPDRKVLRLGSELADVLLVGANTAMVEEFEGVHPDDETLRRRRRHGLADIPPTAVVTTGRTLAVDAPVITKAKVPTIVITCESPGPSCWSSARTRWTSRQRSARWSIAAWDGSTARAARTCSGH